VRRNIEAKEKDGPNSFGGLKADEGGAIADLLKKALTNEQYQMRSNAPGRQAADLEASNTHA
jgi:hypothetical protein